MEGLGGDAKVATGELSILATGMVVVKPLESLPDFLDSST